MTKPMSPCLKCEKAKDGCKTRSQCEAHKAYDISRQAHYKEKEAMHNGDSYGRYVDTAFRFKAHTKKSS